MPAIHQSEKETLVSFSSAAEKLLRTFGGTFGPTGKAAIVVADVPGLIGDGEFGTKLFTQDGWQLIRAFKLANPLEQAAVELLAESGAQSHALSGDGTTCTLILASSLLLESIKLIGTGYPSRLIRRGMIRGCERAVEAIDAMAVAATDEQIIRGVATSALGGRSQYAAAVCQANQLAGDEGYISVDFRRPLNAKQETSVLVNRRDGIELKGSIAGVVGEISTSQPTCVLAMNFDPFATAHDTILSWIKECNTPLLLLCNLSDGDRWSNKIHNNLLDLANQSKQLIIVNSVYGSLNWKVAAAFAGAKVLSPYDGTQNVNEYAGRVRSVEMKMSKLFLHGGKTDSPCFKERVAELVSGISSPYSATGAREVERELSMRSEQREELADLLGKHIQISGIEDTETACNETMALIKNALNAVNSAQRGGVVPGGGAALLHAAPALADLACNEEAEKFGIDVVRKALLQPFHWIVRNAGKEPNSLIEEAKDKGHGFGFDVEHGAIVNMQDQHVVDSVFVVRSAIQHATIAASTALATSSALVLLENDLEDRNADDEMSFRGRRRPRV